MDIVRVIEDRLKQTFSPIHLVIEDRSAAHQGHQGMASGGAHLVLQITSAQFEGISDIARQREIYSLLDSEFKTGAIHALTITAHSVNEWQQMPQHKGTS